LAKGSALLPVNVRRFIIANIPSVPYLEALLLLHSEPNAPWSSTLLAGRLYIPESRAQVLLLQLHQAQIVNAVANEFFYAPDATLRDLIDELSLLYSKHLLEITHLIHSNLDRQAQQFADAFKLRKDP